MQKSSTADSRNRLLLCLFVLGLVTALVVVPFQFRSEAVSQDNKGLLVRTTSHEEGLDYYDIRTDKNAGDTIIQFRQAANRNAAATADLRDKFVNAEKNLRSRIPTLKVEYDRVIGAPEVIGPDVLKGGRDFLTGRSNAKRSDALRAFATDNSDLLGVDPNQIRDLKVTADYTNPDGNLSYAMMEQFIDNVPVFRSAIKAGFTRNGEMFRVVNNLAPALDVDGLSAAGFGDPTSAVIAAAKDVRADIDMTPNAAQTSDLKAVFGDGHYPTTASKYYFPIEPGVARAAWYVIIWKPVSAYEMLIDAETNQVLWRQNMAKDQTQAATYNVWSNTTSPMLAMDSPAPLSPGPIDPALGTQGTLQPRTMVTLIGNEAPNTFNNNGWITDGGNATEGNNTLAGLDRGSPNGVDAPTAGSGTRVFDYASNPAPGNPAPGDNPIPGGGAPNPCPASPSPTINPNQHAAVVQMFYVVNRLHDVLYRHGFNEEARNFQLDNFGRPGTGNDRVLAEGQDCSGSNNANFASSSTDGTVGRMQMYVFTGPTPDRDGTQDAEIIVHEIGHGVTNRLHTGGISGTQGGQMHEGNGDFLAHMLLSESTDPINGVYTTGGYATLNWQSTPPFNNTANYYYGIRRFPKAVIAFTGGPLNRPHNPLTYGDIDPAQINLSNGAFAPAFNGSATAVHDGGEIWSSMLWEVRSRLVGRLGHTAGTSKMLQFTLDGMKMAGSTSRMIDSRNAILAVAAASAAAPEAGLDVADVWAGFAARGMGFLATNPSGNTVVESFAIPDAYMVDPFTVSDAPGNNDGIFVPGEQLSLGISVTNPTAGPLTNVTAVVTGGGTINFGTVAAGATVSGNAAYTVPLAAPCGSLHEVAITVSSDTGSNAPVIKSFRLGELVFTGSSENFDAPTAPALPGGWSTYQTGAPALWVTTTTTPSSAPNAAFVNDPSTAGESSLEVASQITSASATLNFALKYNTEAPSTGTSGFDGAVLEVKIGGGAYQDILAAGGTFGTNGYNRTISTSFSNPLAGRQAWSGDSVNYLPVAVNLPAAANGQQVLFRWRMGTDVSVSDVGVWLDNVVLSGGTFGNGYICDPAESASARADFDADGRTDISVFRPSDGMWHINRSTEGYVGTPWGASGDVVTPGDFDGDGRADLAVFRAAGAPTNWHILNSSDNTYTTLLYGSPGDIPVVGKYDADGKSDVAVYRPGAVGHFYIHNSTGGDTDVPWGGTGDVPLAGDFDGDGRTDISVRRPSNGTFYINQTTEGFIAVAWGVASDQVVHADYDGDGSDDIAVFSTDGMWHILRSLDGGYEGVLWGVSTDVPVPGKYDGDNEDDIAIYRNGTWHLLQSTSGYGTATWGVGSDVALPNSYVP